MRPTKRFQTAPDILKGKVIRKPTKRFQTVYDVLEHKASKDLVPLDRHQLLVHPPGHGRVSGAVLLQLAQTGMYLNRGKSVLCKMFTSFSRSAPSRQPVWL